jgi:hypothetical protein
MRLLAPADHHNQEPDTVFSVGQRAYMSIRAKFVALSIPRWFPASASVTALLSTFLTLSLATRLWGQEPSAQASSVVEAARNARERSSGSAKHSKIITNADLGVAPGASTLSQQPEPKNAAADVPLPAAACDNPQADRLKGELQAAQSELDQLHRDLQYNPPVVSGGNLDLQYFKPGNSGFNVGAPPLLNTQPPPPARIAEFELQERIDKLQKALRLSCEPPGAARIQSAIDDLEQELNLLQRQFALDQEDYYSRPVTERYGGNPQLEAQRQQIRALQAQIQNLREQLAALMPAQGPR